MSAAVLIPFSRALTKLVKPRPFTLRWYSNAADQEETPEKNSDDVRFKILEESLKYVPQYGWSKEAISAGANEIGYPGVIHGLFPRAGADLVHHFQTSSNSKLLTILKQYQKESELQPIPPVEFVEKAIQQKLLMIAPYRKKWPQAIAIMSLPPNVPNALAALLTLVDDICYYAGDRSVDFNWYARRIGIAGIYKTSELFLIQDSSPDHIETFKFLNRRLQEAAQIHDFICRSEQGRPLASDAITSAFTTARNILGLNWNR